ncbi:hypothetical protein DSO57_1014318 [Entomophthora muscae]|uniref:Uncharacterized protein n=1 Tax=Entomophthora muscae TaxID=34485 RepID=A0ACC2TTK8_9FUNG|nr:hypothetical protein DSO57_1014318 [Entomophthora muscae]
MIIRQVKNLTQTGTIKELTRAYKELRLCAPSDMAFDTQATHLMYYNALKLHVMRHMNLDQVTNLQSLYREAEKAEQTSNALHKAQTGKQERPKDSHSSGCSSQPPPGGNGNNNYYKPTGSNGNGNGNNNQSNCIHFCVTATQGVMNNGIHHILILPLLGQFEDKSLAFAFDSQNELASASESMIVWFPDSAQLTRPTHACGK